MKKWTGILIVFLLVIVAVLAAAVWQLYQKLGAASISEIPTFSVSAAPAGQSAADGPQPLPSPTQTSSGAANSGDTITDLNCSVSLGALEIVEGTGFGVSEQSGSGYEAYVDGSTYVVSGSTTSDGHIVVTVPDDFRFQTVTLTVNGGALSAEDVDTQTLITHCDKGSLHFSGGVADSAQVEHLYGETLLTLDGKSLDYNYALSYDLGHIGIGERQYAGRSGSESIDNGAGKEIDIHCSMGSVSVLFDD